MTMDQASFRKLTSVDRRTFLRAGLMAAGVGLVAGSGGLGAFGQVPPRRFAGVRVSRERVIREIVGLRPFRSEGYLVEAQKVGGELLIHNYGHGGAGITLSWGTATSTRALVCDLRFFPFLLFGQVFRGGF